MAKRIGVVLAGSGHLDGSEIHEATLTLFFLSRAGAEAICMAPDKPQMHVVDHMFDATIAQVGAGIEKLVQKILAMA